jgi:hypothetical protein
MRLPKRLIISSVSVENCRGLLPQYLDHQKVSKRLRLMDNFIQPYFTGCKIEPKCYMYFMLHHDLFLPAIVI